MWEEETIKAADLSDIMNSHVNFRPMLIPSCRGGQCGNIGHERRKQSNTFLCTYGHIGHWPLVT